MTDQPLIPGHTPNQEPPATGLDALAAIAARIAADAAAVAHSENPATARAGARLQAHARALTDWITTTRGGRR